MQSVRKDSTTDQVHHRLILDHAAVNIDSAEAALYSPAGTELRAMSNVGVTVNNEVASLKLTWAYDLGVGYRVAWRLSVGVEVYERDTFFRISRRHFFSVVTQADVFKTHPQVQKFLGASPDFSPYLEWAWERILIETERHRLQYPEHIFEPEKFKIAHIAWALAEFYLENTSSRQSDQWDKAEKYETLGDRLLSATLDKIAADANNDGLLSETEDEHKQRTALRLRR